jgi:anthraniloyl-CoA monooxygenase
VFERVRSVWPEERPLAIALNADDWARGGCRIEDAIEAAAAFKRRGCDLIDVLAGQTTPASRPSYDPGFLAGYSDSIRNQARVATMTSGNITTTVQVNTLIAAGRADLCVLNR